MDYHCSEVADLGQGGVKSKYRTNIAAIQTLKAIEREHRMANGEEQLILARYTGWGGIPQAFDEKAKGWSDEYQELKALLTPEEYESARASTPNAHYTSPEVIRAIYAALFNFGFESGNVLEPAAGTGNFFALLPESMRGAKLYGVELDSLSGRICQQLHQTAHIQVKGYEDTVLPDNFFDVAVGNVPFGDYKLYEPRYNKLNLNIHDHFFVKTLDKVRPGGVIAFVTSKGTLDKQDDAVRRYLAERADLIGAVRLPRNTFSQIANTEVTADILFLQKRQDISHEEPSWLKVGQTEDGVPVNQYYLEHPEQMLGTMVYDVRMFGADSKYTALDPHPGQNIEEALTGAVFRLHAVMEEYDGSDGEQHSETLEADVSVKNHTYTFVGTQLYYRENGWMRRIDAKGKTLERITALHELRQDVRRVINLQLAGAEVAEVQNSQSDLIAAYDRFYQTHGSVNARENKAAFRDDADYPLLCSLEVIDNDGNIQKADIFTKQTIRPVKEITSADTSQEALTVSMNQRGRVDIPYMAALCDKTPETVIEELRDIVYLDPVEFTEVQGKIPHSGYVTADEYLSGNVRRKLQIARDVAQETPELFARNIAALDKVQLPDIPASDISVRIGVRFVDNEDYERFLYETLQTPIYCRRAAWRTGKQIQIVYNAYDATWAITNKGLDSKSVSARQTYGTKRINAYEIMEASLNQRDACVYDLVETPEGKERYVLNGKETAIAKDRQRALNEHFRDWLFLDPDRRQKYVARYNELFNSVRLREYDGSHQTFPNMNPDIQMRPHQLNAIARGKYGGNTLLAHVVGAGKSFEMDAIIMEKRRLGLCRKALMVVPNHLTEQSASELLRLYPSAGVLVATRRDFEKDRRRRFFSRIATGDYDCVIMGFSQFEKLPMSKEYQAACLKEEVDQVSAAIASLQEDAGNRLSVKQYEKLKLNLETQIKRLNEDSGKDDVMTFEELGFDMLVVDEAHYYKNCAIYTKMRNIAGLSDTRAKKSADMLMKIKYMNELTRYTGVIFATGTPLTNSMTEMYVMTRYLRPDLLNEQGLTHFDLWAAGYGEVVTQLELAPSGKGFRMRNRFSKFSNLPELLTTFRTFADIQTADQLNLPVPKLRGGKPTIVSAKPSDFQKAKIEDFVKRSDRIREGNVNPRDDNMLVITHEARLMSADQRLLDPGAPNEPNSKVNKLVEIAYEEYRRTESFRGVQLIFCDVGTPKAGGSFSVYQYIKDSLIELGVTEKEIAFIHDAKNEDARKTLFSDCRAGRVRFLLGSTPKLGCGTNIQDRLTALHHLDCPWRPADIEQREGRILRQGNSCEEVSIYRYVTEGTFDAYLWSIVQNKQKFISQIMTGKTLARNCQDIDPIVLSYAEVQAVASGDPRIREKIEIDAAVTNMQTLKAEYKRQRYSLQDQITITFPKQISDVEQKIEGVVRDMGRRDVHAGQEFSMTVGGKVYDAQSCPDENPKERTGDAIRAVAERVKKAKKDMPVGTYKGFDLSLSFDPWGSQVSLVIRGALTYRLELSDSSVGMIQRLENALNGLEKHQAALEAQHMDYERDLAQAQLELGKPFEHEDELAGLLSRQAELAEALSIEKPQEEVVGEAEGEGSGAVGMVAEDEEREEEFER